MALVTLCSLAAPVAAAKCTALGRRDFLSCSGSLLRTRDGRALTLRGVNIGGWLVYESWMCPADSAQAGIDLVTTLERRFGADGAQELLDCYRDSFFTEHDLDIIADMGFNCIRVPFWYRNFQSDDNGTWIRNEKGEIDFSRLDWVVEQCGKRGIYVILDAHGLPGFQNSADHCGDVDNCRLYDDTAEGVRFRALACDFLREIARHFNGNPVVAAYDLMNEPMPNGEDGAEKDKKRCAVYEELYDAVRSVDKKHIITVEAIWRFENLGSPESHGWSNVLYQLHLYQNTTAEFDSIIGSSREKSYSVPIYVGEFRPLTEEADWVDVLNIFNTDKCSWTSWAYKGVCRGADDSEWFVVVANAESSLIDVNNSSFSEIKQKWGEPLKTENGFHKTGAHLELEAAAKAEVAFSLFEKIHARFEDIRKFFALIF